MAWLALTDGVLWGVTLIVSFFLARLVCHRRDLPARLFQGMVIALSLPQFHYLFASLVEFVARLVPGSVPLETRITLWSTWPPDVVAAVAFASLTLHLFLVFPTQSRIIRAWRWSPLLIYLPAAFLIAVSLSQLALGPERYSAFWGLDALGLTPSAPQLLFVILTVGLALIRLLIIHFSRATPRVRQQLIWLLWGLVLGGGFVLLGEYLPSLLGLTSQFGWVPGLRQLPILILLGAFGLSMQRYHIFAVEVVISRSVIYSALMALLMLLYLALSALLGYLFQSLSGTSASPLALSLLTTLLVALVALPLRDVIQRLVDPLFFRRRASYRHLLQDFSRALTTPLALTRLLEMVADQVEGVFHPMGICIVLPHDQEGYQVALARGKLAADPRWRPGARCTASAFVPLQLAGHDTALYLPWHLQDLLPVDQDAWQPIQASGVELLIPMHLREKLLGWIALGPRRSDLAYSRQDLDFMCALADQACVALENARLLGEMQRRATELAMLAMVSSAISSSLDLENVLETIVESVVKVVNCEKSAIFEMEEDGRSLTLRMSKGLSDAYVAAFRTISPGRDNPALSPADARPFIVADVLVESRLAHIVEPARREGFRGLVDLPLAGRDGILGILSVFFNDVHTPTPDELEILTTLANHASVAIENARLYAAATRERDRAQRLYQQADQALAQRVEELTAIEEISRQLAGTLDLQHLLDLVLERSIQATQADRGVISLYDAPKGGLQLLSQEGFGSSLERYRTELWSHDLGITGRVARTGVAVVLADAARDPDFVAVASMTRSQLTVPIVHKERVLGIITLESDRRAAFSAEHLRFAELLADHTAIGIHNARLFQQVREGRDRLEAILNSTRDAVVVLNTAGRVILTNRRVPELLGPSVERWLWSSNVIEESLDPDSQIFCWTDLGADKLVPSSDPGESGADGTIELAFGFQNGGERRYIELTASPVVGLGGEIFGWVAIVRDMTRQHELEIFREDLTSMIIHNLQGPLAAVIGSLEYFLDIDDMDDETAEQLVRIAVESSKKLNSRINSLLWLRRLEDSQIPLNLQKVPLPPLVESVMEEYVPIATMTGVTMETALVGNLPPVWVDRELVVQVFSNLLDNALKYTPAQGHIRIQARSIQTGSEPLVICTVADTGVGIADDVKSIIFGKFRRGSSHKEGRRRGAGIGLYYCQLAIQAHGGRIWVESQLGQGSTFYFTLPVYNGPR